MNLLSISKSAIGLAQRLAPKRSLFLILITSVSSVLDLLVVFCVGIFASSLLTSSTKPVSSEGLTLVNQFLEKTRNLEPSEEIFLGFAFLIILIVKNLLNIFVIKICGDIIAQIRNAFARSLFREYLASSFLATKQRKGELVSYALLDGTNSLFFGILLSLQTLLAEILVLVLLMTLSIFVSVKLAIGSLIFLFIVMYTSTAITKKFMVTNAQILRDSTITMRGQILESTNLIREIKVHKLSERVANEFKLPFMNNSKAYTRLYLVQQVPKQIFEFSSIVLIILLGVVTEISSGDKATTVGIFVAILIRILPSLLKIQSSIGSLRANMSGAEHSLTFRAELKNSESSQHFERSTDTFIGPVGVRFTKVHFQYNEQEILSGADLDIRPSTITAITGISGTGKSTVCELLLGLLVPKSGNVEFVDLNGDFISNQNCIRIGYVAQNVQLINGSVRKNLEFSSSASIPEPELWSVLDAVRLTSFIRKLPHSLDQSVGPAGGFLSGGQRQRLGIARELLTNPNIIILDEPTSSLDVLNTSEIYSILKSLKSKCTIILVTHDPSALESANEVVFLENGQIRTLN